MATENLWWGLEFTLRAWSKRSKTQARVKTQVHCFGAPRTDAIGYELRPPFTEINPALQTLLIDMDMATHMHEVDLVHSHTWYANFAGYLASKIQNIPHVVTAHSLEPLRPWKAEQLGGGYLISSWSNSLHTRTPMQSSL